MGKKISTTLANFADIRTLDCVYVDKTKQIYDCILGIDKYFFLARPRRFGKSLLCTTLREIFLGNKDLFKGLWIEQSDWQWTTHPVIHLDMTCAAGGTNTISKMEEALRIQLAQTATEYGIDLPLTEGMSSAFKLLIIALYEKTGKCVVVIIDEYDKPILDLVNNPTERNLIHAALRDFYSPLKPLEKYLHKVFITGVYKFTQTSVFSNLNNLNDLTFKSKAGTLVGYTKEEVETYFSEEINQLATIFKINQEQMIERLRALYNGYHFGVNVNTGELSTSVYNSYAMNNVFADLQLIEKWFSSGSPQFLISKIREGMFESIGPDGLNTSFIALQTSCGPDAIDATSLLYYAGYATMHAYCPVTREVKLGYPNLEVSEATANQLIALFRTGTPSILNRIAFKIADCFKTHNFSKLKELFNQALAQITHQIIVQQEKYFQTVILLILQMGRLRAEAEIPTNDGRMDIVIELPQEVIIIEVKFNKTAIDGLKQIIEKDYAKKFRSQEKQITAIGLNIGLGDDTKQKSCVVDMASIEFE